MDYISKAHNKKLDFINSIITEKLDVNFNSTIKRIETLEEFNDLIFSDYVSGKKLFYRGERINRIDRHLVATMFRNKDLFSDSEENSMVHVDAKFIFDYYSSLGDFVKVFHNTMGNADCDNLYEICAFAQHYFKNSPLIDFSKNLYSSLSFALKGRSSFEDDIVLYVIEIKDDNHYTSDIAVANEWLSNINLYVSNFNYELNGIIGNKHKEIVKGNIAKLPIELKKRIDDIEIKSNLNPVAKFIDVPTNTRMKFQNGVFLLLDDYHLINGSYFTKNIRKNFLVQKFLINKDICPLLIKLIEKDAPWYSYDNLMDVEAAFNTAVNSNT